MENLMQNIGGLMNYYPKTNDRNPPEDWKTMQKSSLEIALLAIESYFLLLNNEMQRQFASMHEEIATINADITAIRKKIGMQ